jgi:hypothetical protein
MGKNIHNNIQEKIDSLQNALLRFKHNGKKVSLCVKVTVNEDDSLNCLLVSDDLPFQKLSNKDVTLIQRDHENYMYIGGRIAQKAKANKMILSIDIQKASWFIRRSKGSVTWLQEKCVYMPEQLDLAS